MPSNNDSKKQILKSSSIIGGASFLTIIIGVIKVKALAVLLGPAGIGLLGILGSMLSTATVLFSMGLGTSGVRELALSKENVEKLELVRKALFTANILLGFLVLILAFIFKGYLSDFFFQDAKHELDVLVISFGVFFSLISISQTTLLQGFRKIGDLAKVKVISALAASVAGIVLILQLGEKGVPYFVIIFPLMTCIVAFFYNRKLPRISSRYISFKELKPQWYSLITMGFVLMLTGFMSNACQLTIRYILNQELNIESIGYFQAAWSISMTYIGFILGAMSADYYPRLTQIIKSRGSSNQLVNEQTEVALILAAPILLGMLTFAPIIINLLYSSEFSHSIEILRWQVFGDILKVITWPLGFIILAQGRSKLFFCTELVWNLSYILLVFFGINYFNLEITGYAFASSYLILLILVYFLATKINSFRWSKNNIILIFSLLFLASVLLITSYFSEWLTIFLGILFTAYAVQHALKMILKLEIKNSKITKIINIYQNIRSILKLK